MGEIQIIKKNFLAGKSEGKLPVGSHSCRQGYTYNITKIQLREWDVRMRSGLTL